MSEYNESISHSLVNSRQGIPEGLVGISQIREGRKIFQSSLLVFQFNFFFSLGIELSGCLWGGTGARTPNLGLVSDVLALLSDFPDLFCESHCYFF